MKKIRWLSGLAAFAVVVFAANYVAALPAGSFLQNAIDFRTDGGSSSVNVKSDMVSDTKDSFWKVKASGASAHTLLFEMSAFKANTSFGIYKVGEPTNKLEVFSGGDSNNGTPFDGALSTLYYFGGYYSTEEDFSTYVNFESEIFGYYLDVPDEGETYYSDTSLNTDGVDHMLAYQGTGEDDFKSFGLGGYSPWTSDEYILAWEDMYNGGDLDYTDFVAMVGSVTATPEPGTMLLFGTGIAGLAGVIRRRKK